jgi:hypothetical protein
MVSRNRFIATIGLMLVLLLSSVRVTAQQTSTTGDWGSLRNLPTESKLVVKLKTGKTVEGKLSSVSDTSLIVVKKNTQMELKRDNVASIYQVTKKSTTSSTLIGMGIGAGAGAGLGAIGVSTDNSGYDFDKLDKAFVAGLTVLGAGAGAITGYLVGKGSSKRTLIYQSK